MTWWRGGAQQQPARDLDKATGHPQYDALPTSIKALYTPREWLWLSDSAKANLVQTETEPDDWDAPA